MSSKKRVSASVIKKKKKIDSFHKFDEEVEKKESFNFSDDDDERK